MTFWTKTYKKLKKCQLTYTTLNKIKLIFNAEILWGLFTQNCVCFLTSKCMLNNTGKWHQKVLKRIHYIHFFLYLVYVIQRFLTRTGVWRLCESKIGETVTNRVCDRFTSFWKLECEEGDIEELFYVLGMIWKFTFPSHRLSDLETSKWPSAPLWITFGENALLEFTEVKDSQDWPKFTVWYAVTYLRKKYIDCSQCVQGMAVGVSYVCLSYVWPSNTLYIDFMSKTAFASPFISSVMFTTHAIEMIRTFRVWGKKLDNSEMISPIFHLQK
jgi:hypothetical protein